MASHGFEPSVCVFHLRVVAGVGDDMLPGISDALGERLRAAQEPGVVSSDEDCGWTLNPRQVFREVSLLHHRVAERGVSDGVHCPVAEDLMGPVDVRPFGRLSVGWGGVFLSSRDLFNDLLKKAHPALAGDRARVFEECFVVALRRVGCRAHQDQGAELMGP